MTITLTALRKRIRAKKRLLGISEAEISATRNSGLRRTQEKRDFLARVEARAVAAGEKPVPSNY
jgi:hypothetical protein